nr:ANTAR domain-containing protein [Rhodococcus wratislaviensis]
MGDGLGSLNLYSRVGRAFSEFDAALLRVYASLIASTIRLARDGREAREEVAGLIKAMESRSIIEQAKGIVMATGGVSADEAFDFLVVSSQQRNIKLARLAKELVDLTSAADGVKAIARKRDYSRLRQGTSILTSSSCPDATTARLPG